MAHKNCFLHTVLFVSILLPFTSLEGKVERLRCMWRTDPATTMVVGWDQVTGSNPILFYGKEKGGRNISKYAFNQKVDRAVRAKGQNNYFVRLKDLEPNTLYHFVIKDSEGTSEPYSFRTAPDNPRQRLSIVAGGDSRNYRAARQRANQMVAKLRPHVVLFSGDMTGGNTDQEWIEWLDDWQLTITEEGRLTPIIVARGNHEFDNETLYQLFDLPRLENYYALSLGGNLLRVITLNSNISSKGDQLAWLENELKTHRNAFWKIVQYHHPIRPHTSFKLEQDDLYTDWAGLFYQYGVNLIAECDAHVVKITWPVRPSWEPGSEEGFIRDDNQGMVFVGEGGWGAPLRLANDEKSWTRATGSFNQFQWIFLDGFQMEIRIIPTDQVETVPPLKPGEFFRIPKELRIWSPPNGKVNKLLRKPNNQILMGLGDMWDQSQVLTSSTSIAQLDAIPYGSGIRLQWLTQDEPEGMYYTVQRRTEQEFTFSTVHSFTGNPGKSNLHQYIDLDLAGVSPNSWLEYRLIGKLPSGLVKMSTIRTQRPAQVSLDPALTQLEIRPGTRQVTLPFTLSQKAEVAAVFIDEKQHEVLRKVFPPLPPGTHNKEVDLSELPRGKYVVRLQARGENLVSFQLNI